MEILNSQPEDIDLIFSLYEQGTAYQKTVAEKHWKGFDRGMVMDEIRHGRQYKIMIDGQVACIFCISFSDPHIWLERNKDPAIYLHRIATDSSFRRRGLVKNIVEWVTQYARKNHKRFIRMDTGSGNEKLNSYYVGCGFRYLGITQLNNTDGLPDHYKAGSSSLFEIDIEDSDLKELPEDLMPPVNDGACSHLPGVIIPNLSLWTTEGKKVLLSNLQGLLVIYCYPMTGAPGIVLPEGWDAIPGARGCTPQACSFRDHYSQLRELNAAVYGISTQSTEILKKEKARIHLPFELISDQDLCFAKALKLPVFEVQGTSYLKRVTLIFSEGKIIKYFYPVFPPDRNGEEVLKFLKSL
nr:GNAT family N-acetyltransferase [Pedobacter panaciterrae]